MAISTGGGGGGGDSNEPTFPTPKLRTVSILSLLASAMLDCIQKS